MAVYLFRWDPTRWDWRNLGEQAEQVARGAPVVRAWSCGTNRRIFAGDVAYLIRQGREPRGIFARAEVVRGAYETPNADVPDANRGRNTLVVDLRFTRLENAVNKVVLSRGDLQAEGLAKFVWDIRESGVKIPDAIAAALEERWSQATGAPSPAPAKPATETPVAPAKAHAKARTPASPPKPPRKEDSEVPRDGRTPQVETAGREQRPEPPAARRPDAAQRNEILVQNYFLMLAADVRGELYSKADHRNRILAELGETDVEQVNREHRQISAVLAETGLPFVDGFPPEAGFDAALEKAVHMFIEGNPERVEALWIDEAPSLAGIPVELDDAKAHWVTAPEASAFRPSGRPAWHPAGVNEIDYRVREAQDRNLAIAGERFVLAFERARLREAGMKDSIEAIAWQSQTFGDSFGYDIRSPEPDGGDRLICVKTTHYGSRFPFTLTHRELERARENAERFYVYRVFRFSRAAKLFMIPAARLLQHSLEPVAFRSWI